MCVLIVLCLLCGTSRIQPKFLMYEKSFLIMNVRDIGPFIR